MEFAIFIPTYKRENCRTLQYIPEEYKKQTFIVQRADDLTLDPLDHDFETLITSHEHYPIAKTREFIGEFCKKANIPKFVMLDDDLNFYVRKEGVYNLRYCETSDVVDLFRWIETSLDKYSHVSISAREGNNRVFPETYKTVTRPMRVLGFRTEDFNSVKHARVEVMEDFDVTLQLLRKGKPNIVSYHFAQGQGKSNEKGGCSEMRTPELQKRSAEKLAELHSDFVKVKIKHTKGDAWFGEGKGRHDVIVQWKKAFKEGVDNLLW